MKNLGTISSSASCGEFITNHKIDTGEFEDIELGDYVTIYHDGFNGYQETDYLVNSATSSEWLVAGLDWKYQAIIGGPNDGTKHHIVLFPRKSLIQSKIWSSAYSYDEAFTKSYMTTVSLKSIDNVLKNALGSFILTVYRGGSSNLSTVGVSMAGANTSNYTSQHGFSGNKSSLLSEAELCGCIRFGSSWYENYAANSILPLFNIQPFPYWWILNKRFSFWTSTFAFDNFFVKATESGAYRDFAYETGGVRPIIFIG